MKNKEFNKAIETLIDGLATSHSYSQDKEHLRQLRESLFRQAHEILSAKLTGKLADRLADDILDSIRAERRQRQKTAATTTDSVETMDILSLETGKNRVLA